ncbi:hypothetical protein NFI96_003096 [Prochilodus magdalenae]|nr:hypothetical protein NFI96_003096 [Prochilodus magdalenae]
MERLVLEQLRPMVQPLLDPLQFAYQPRLGVEDAIIYLLNRVYSHLDKPASTVRVMFFYFSSAFNTIQPALLGDKLNVMQVDAPLVSWIVDYLTGRPQYVRLQHCVSDRVVSNTGAPQGTVLSPFLFTLYTTDFNYCTETCHLQKFSDDSAVVGCISRGDEDEYRATVNDFVAWCELNHLQLNVTKTKELVVDLRRDKAQVTPISIKGVSVDTVEDYKYLGVHIDNKLDWAKNTDALYKKGQSRLYFLRRLRSFNICRTMLRIFYESVVASAILYAVACWGSRLRVADANRLIKLIRKASDVVGVELDSLMAVSERRTLSKLQTIMDNGSHPLYHTKFRWLCLLLIAVLLVLWYSHLIRTRNRIVDLGLHGYQRIPPSDTPGVLHLALQCRRCAVVSSSGHMRGSGQGSEIDGHDCVIRMNAAPTWGFQADVGNRTTVRVVSHTSVPHLLQRKDLFFRHEADTLYVVWGPDRNMRQDGKGRVFNTLVKLARTYTRTHIYTVTKEKVLFCDRVFQDETGKNSVANHTSVPYHYYETYRLDECAMYRMHERAKKGGHRFITEKRIYKRWASQGKIRFPYPTWDMPSPAALVFYTDLQGQKSQSPITAPIQDMVTVQSKVYYPSLLNLTGMITAKFNTYN